MIIILNLALNRPCLRDFPGQTLSFNKALFSVVSGYIFR